MGMWGNPMVLEVERGFGAVTLEPLLAGIVVAEMENDWSGIECLS
jgi:hypothetical protein